ncbi:MAG TPA: hypothetical protein VNK82_02410 [Terriglobales bacterium]|nr:hypothetical protein [Terriglobales bacterium]
MSRPLLGLLLGGVLGLLDGLSGYLYPELAPVMATVILYSTLKGFVSGTIIGLVARRMNSLPLGIVSGLTVGVVFSYLVALTAEATLFWDIMLPGALLGLIVGFATQKFGRPVAQAR